MSRRERRARPLAAAMLFTALLALPVLALSTPGRAEDQVVTIVDDAAIGYRPDEADAAEAPAVASTAVGVVIAHRGQAIDATLDLPDWPKDPAAMRRLVLTVEVAPIAPEGRPVDPWTRLGRVLLLPDPPASPSATPEPPLELMRFITGFGTEGTFAQDVTSYGPALSGRVTIRTFLSTYAKGEAWRVRVTLAATSDGAGARRPRFVRPLVDLPEVVHFADTMSAVFVMPSAMTSPRLRILSTGHATDGQGANEFVTATHIVRVDGIEVARFRPWREDGGLTRESNRWAGRQTIDGREIWSSDLDRSGWAPGRVVEPILLPVPELTPGRHRVEIQVVGIRPPDDSGAHGYWVTSMAVVADEPWE